nr:protein fantom-like [Pocillopora verrucosa]
MPVSSAMDGPPSFSVAEDGDGRHFSEIYARQLISKISREELEDKYLRLQEDNQELKKYARKQEEKIKKMATKLLRLVHDKKREATDGVSAVNNVDTREKMADLEAKIVDLEKQNVGLKNKLTVAKQQLQTQGKRATPYDHVKPRVQTGIHARTPSGNRLKKDLRVQGHDMKPGSRVPPPMLPQPRYGHSLLEEARLEKRELEELIAQLQDQIQLLDEDGAQLREQLRQTKLRHEDEIMQLKEQVSDAQRSNIQENVDLIKLQREMKEKATKFEALQAKYLNLEENLAKVKASHTQVLEDMEKLNEELKKEQTKNFALKNDLKTGGIASKSLSEQLQMIGDLKAENAILKEANENLVTSAFDAERERQHRAKYRQMEVEMEQLRATLHSDLQEKNDILDKLTSERESAEKLNAELRELRVQHYTLKEQYDDLKEKMKFFTKESAVDFQEIEEALVLIKHRKEKGSQDLDFLEKVDDEKSKDMKRQVQELQAAHADTINELEKTRNMLIIQHKINKDYQTEVERVTKKMTEDKKEYDLKMQEYAQLLDIRADRIRKLESQMRDVAYGTKQYKAAPLEQDSEFEEMDSTVELERGQNIFEIHIDKVILSQEAMKEFEDDEPVTFVTYEFFEHELQTTPVVKGTRPEFNFTSQYLVRVDDFFLHFLQKESTLIEIHRAFGTDYKTVAACQLKFRDLLEKPHGRVHGTATLIGTRPPCQGIEFATLEYWVRLRVPMDQAIRLYRERTKALGYMNSGAYKALEDAGHVPDKPPSDVNELDIHVVRCNAVQPRRPGIQPCPYAVYRFFDFADHDTDIVQSTNTPEFNDVKTFPVPMTTELDTYLRAAALEIYVFDDADPEPTVYLGLAKVPLITLANDKPVKGTFELRKPSGGVNGTIDVYLKWRYTYLPASAKPRAAPQRVMRIPDDNEPFSSDSETAFKPVVKSPKKRGKPLTVNLHSDSEPEFKPAVKSPNKREKPPSPVDSSTPKQEQREEKVARRESAQLQRKPSDQKEKSEARVEKEIKEKLLESMSVDELVEATAQKPQPAPRTRKVEPEKPVEEMSIDEMAKVVEETREEPGNNVKSTGEISETSEDEQNDKALVAEEMRRTTEAEASEDTMFEERHSESDFDSTLGEEVDIPLPAAESGEELDEEGEENEEEIDEEVEEDEEQDEEDVGQEESKEKQEKEDDAVESGTETSENEVVVSPRHSRAKSVVNPTSTVVIQVTSLTLDSEAPILQDPNVKQLFVAYKFLDYEPADLETPISLPKPAPYRPIYYNFKKVFYVDEEKNEGKRNYLIYMLSNDPKLVFTVVSDPPDDDDEGDCVDVAYASVDFQEILYEGDVIDKDLALYDTESHSEIGTLTVSVEATEALRDLYKDQ